MKTVTPYSCQPDARVSASAASRSMGKSFFQFVLSGGACFLLGTALLYFLTDICKIYYLVSVLVSSLLTNGLGFWLNRRFAFRGQANSLWRELKRYYVVSTSALAFNLVMMAVCVSGLGIPYLVASIGLAVVLAFSNFLLHRVWSFGKP